MPNFDALIPAFPKMAHQERQNLLQKFFNTPKGIRYQNTHRGRTANFIRTFTKADRAYVTNLYRATDLSPSVTTRRRKYRAAQLERGRPPLSCDPWELTYEDDQEARQKTHQKTEQAATKVENIDEKLDQYLAERDAILAAEDSSGSNEAMSEENKSEDSD